MRFALVPVALLALSRSLVHAAPSVASDHANSLAVRQGTVVDVITSLLEGLGFSIQEIQNILKGLGDSANVKLARADPTSVAASTTSDVSPASRTQASASIISNPSSVSSSTSQASPTFPVRMRRQLPLSSVVPGPLSALPTSVASAVLSKIGSATSDLAPSKPSGN